MVLKKEELVLFALSLIEEDDRPNLKFTKDQVAYALDINTSTLDLYLTHLKNKGLIERHKKKYVDDFRQTFNISDHGRKKVKDVVNNIKKEVLTPERHNVPSIVPLTRILPRISDTLERIFFLALYSKVIRFDLPFYLETIKTAKLDSNMVNTLLESGVEQELEQVPAVETFFKTCFYGDINIDVEDPSCFGSNVNTLLIIAEASYKKGRFSDAHSIYDHLLSGKIPITNNQWFIANIGKCLLLSKEGKIEESLIKLDNIKDRVDTKIFQTFVEQVQARILSTTERRDESMELFNHVIRSFQSQGIPLLLAISYNNRGILHFRMENVMDAEEDWKMSRKYLKEAKCRYLEAPLFANLADIEIQKGNLIKSEKYLKQSYDRYLEYGDFEGVSIADFNYALLYLEKKDLEKALKYIHKSEEIAYPSPSVLERKERREVFIERAQKNGFMEVDLN